MPPKTRRNLDKKSVIRPSKRTGKKGSPSKKMADPNIILIYGLHAARAALLNPERKIISLSATPNALDRLALPRGTCENISVQPVTSSDLTSLLGEDCVHQGILVKARPLPTIDIETIAASADRQADLPSKNQPHHPPARSIILALDQVTDPHNVGAILRSAAVFGTAGLLMTSHHAPPLSGVLAKTASGGLDHVPILQVSNLARGLEKFARLGYQIIGLAGEGEHCLEDLPAMERTVLVMGSEEKGMRRLTREKCDLLCRLKTGGTMSTLNVSNAAAISLHILATKS